MISIFLSYRRADYEDFVKELENLLTHAFGFNSIVIDQKSFVGGSEWLQQIRSHVIQSNVIVCAIGQSWLINHQYEIDFVSEELNLARNLGKKIIPVAIDSLDLNQVYKIIPKNIEWLLQLQIIKFRVQDKQTLKLLIETIREITGESSSNNTQNKQTLLDPYNPIRRTFNSLFYPISEAGLALKPDSKTLITSLKSLIIVSAIFSITSILYSPNALTMDEFFSWIIIPVRTTLLLILFLLIFIYLTRKKISINSLASYAIQFSATLYICFCFYSFLQYMILGINDKTYLQDLYAEMGKGQNPIEAISNAANLINAKSSIHSLILSSLSNLGGIIHIVYISWGYVRAFGSLIITGRKIATFLLLTLITLFSLSIYFTQVFNSPLQLDVSLFAKKLPADFIYSNGSDTELNGNIQYLPIKVNAKAGLNINGSNLEIKIDQLIIANRTDKRINNSHFFCEALSIDKSGKIFRIDPSPISKNYEIGVIKPKETQTINDIHLGINLPTSLHPGETTMLCYVWALKENNWEYFVLRSDDIYGIVLRW